MSGSTSSKQTTALAEGAVMVAAAEVLGYIKLWHMPEGGSISLVMLPIIIYSLRWGLKKGLLSGLALGIIDFIMGGGIAIAWQSILGDYIIACMLLGLAGVGKGRGLLGYILGAVLGCLGRFVSVWVTGATLWGIYMYDIYGLPMDNEWVYSFLYNLPVLISGALTVAAALLLKKPLEKLPKAA